MTVKSFCAAAALASTFMAFATGALAQDSEFLGEERDWRAYKVDTGNGPLCWAASEPKSSDYSRDVSARGDAYLMVAVAPAANVTNGEVSVRAGFPFDQNQPVAAKIGSRNFTFFAEGEDAWLESADLDPQMITAMRRGASAEVTSTSSRGTTATDTYSLYGFTAMYNRAVAACR